MRRAREAVAARSAAKRADTGATEDDPTHGAPVAAAQVLPSAAKHAKLGAALHVPMPAGAVEIVPALPDGAKRAVLAVALVALMREAVVAAVLTLPSAAPDAARHEAARALPLQENAAPALLHTAPATAVVTPPQDGSAPTDAEVHAAAVRAVVAEAVPAVVADVPDSQPKRPSRSLLRHGKVFLVNASIGS